jgi:hypothetical protein
MNITEVNHLVGAFLIVSFVMCLPKFDTWIHNLFVVAFWISFLVWTSTGLYLFLN